MLLLYQRNNKFYSFFVIRVDSTVKVLCEVVLWLWYKNTIMQSPTIIASSTIALLILIVVFYYDHFRIFTSCFYFSFFFFIWNSHSLANLIYLFRCKVDNEIIWIPSAIRKVPITWACWKIFSQILYESGKSMKHDEKKRRRGKQTIDTIMREGFFFDRYIFRGNVDGYVYHPHMKYIYHCIFNFIPFTCMFGYTYILSIYRDMDIVCSIYVEHFVESLSLRILLQFDMSSYCMLTFSIKLSS